MVKTKTMHIPESGPGNLRLHTSGLLNVPHGMFLRSGGVSTPPFAGLNLSFTVGDDAANVAENRRRVKECLGLRHLVSVVQVHGNRTLVLDACEDDIEIQGGHDALLTDLPGVGLLIQQADCQAVLLHDPVRRVIAAVHSGWRGSVTNIIGKTVTAMQLHYNSDPADLVAVISPSLGPCCAQFINYRRELPQAMHQWQVRPDYFDFRAISREQLIERGLRPDHIDTVAVWTMCNPDFFSYRRAVKRDNPVTGRNGSVIALPE